MSLYDMDFHLCCKIGISWGMDGEPIANRLIRGNPMQWKGQSTNFLRAQIVCVDGEHKRASISLTRTEIQIAQCGENRGWRVVMTGRGGGKSKWTNLPGQSVAVVGKTNKLMQLHPNLKGVNFSDLCVCEVIPVKKSTGEVQKKKKKSPPVPRFNFENQLKSGKISRFWHLWIEWDDMGEGDRQCQIVSN
jgi:hypothetical protein